MAQPQGARLVGSVNYNDAETTIRTAANILGDRLKRIPDGEVGDAVAVEVARDQGRRVVADGDGRVDGEPAVAAAVASSAGSPIEGVVSAAEEARGINKL